MPTPMLKVRSRSRRSTRPRSPISPNTGCGVHGRAIDVDRDMLGQHPGQVGREPASGHVTDGVDVDRGCECQAVAGIDARRLEQFLADRTAEGIEVRV